MMGEIIDTGEMTIDEDWFVMRQSLGKNSSSLYRVIGLFAVGWHHGMDNFSEKQKRLSTGRLKTLDI